MANEIKVKAGWFALRQATWA